jgi:succinoglycan biosynthesis transport protein ExoP
MLQAMTQRTVAAAEPPETGQHSKLLQLGLGFARRQYWIVLVSLGLTCAAGAFYILNTRPTYTAAVTLMIDSRRGGIQQKSVLGDQSVTDSTWIDSQIGVLTLERDDIGQALVKSMHLADDPEIVPAKKDTGSGSASSGTAWLNYFGGNDDDVASQMTDDDRARFASGVVANGLEVARVGFSYLFNVKYSSHSREEAVKIANAAADAYVAAELKSKFDDLGQASNWLRDRYQTLRDQATAADRAVLEFKNSNKIVTSGGNLINDQQLTEINSRISAARAKTADAKAKVDQITAVLQDQDANGTVDSTVSDALLNPIVGRLRGQYLDIVNKEKEWSKRFGPNHQAVTTLRRQEIDLRTSMHEELKRIAGSYVSDYEISKSNEAELEKQLTGIVAAVPNEAEITLRGLESSAQSYRKFYDNFLLNYTESIQQQTSPFPDTRVISYATFAFKTHPSVAQISIWAILSGLVIGACLGALREILDTGFRASQQVQPALQKSCLAMIPLMDVGYRNTRILPRRIGNFGRTIDENGDDRRIVDASFGALRYVIDAPFSRFSESIRALKLSADMHGERHRPSKVIGLTSSVPGEGKSTVAAALAGLVAQTGASVILLDCDLRNPALSDQLAPGSDAGILEVVSGERTLDSVIWTNPETGMDFLPGAKVRLSNAQQVLVEDSMRDLFDTLRRNYEYVIVDFSPLLPVVDVRAATDLIDSYIFIVEWGETKIDVVREAIMLSHELYDKLVGVAMNKVNMNLIGRYEGSREKYYGNKYFSRYYQTN